MRRLMNLRKRDVASRLKKAMLALREEMKYVMATQPKDVADVAWR